MTHFHYAFGSTQSFDELLFHGSGSLHWFDLVYQEKQVGVAHCCSVWGVTNDGMSTITQRGFMHF